jgi:integrase
VRGRVTRRCGCTYVDETGKRKQYGGTCPKLRRADGGWNTRHGSWYAIYSLDVRGKTKRFVRGGFDTSTAAHDHMEQARGKSSRGVDMARERLTVKQFLTEWLASKTDVRSTTMRSYEGHVKRYFIPELGWLRMDQLRTSHIADMLTKVDATPATKQRVRATLRSALSDAVREGLLMSNPATHVRIPSGKRPRALVWTPELEAEFAHTGQRPSPVTIWRPDQLGTFLDAVAEHRLYAYFHLLAYRGLRRGEGLGLEWPDLSLDAGTLTVRRQRSCR